MTEEALSMTPREQEIAQLVLQGYQSVEIAEQLQISGQSVKNRLRAIYSRAKISGPSKRVQFIKTFSRVSEKKSLPALSDRQRLVAELAISGATNRQIAVRLTLSPHVVRNYLHRVFDKCGVWSRTELAARFRSNEKAS